jgi:hypothetical protein
MNITFKKNSDPVFFCDLRKARNKVTVQIRVKSEASAEEFTELAMYSPVYDMVSRSPPVEFTLTS